MKLKELFDKPVPYEWTTQSDETWNAEFDIGPVHYEFIALVSNPYPDEDEDVEIEIEFFHRTERGVPTHKVSGVGNEHILFATVVSIMRDVITNMKPDTIIYSAAEPNRARLYKRMLSRLLPTAKTVHYNNKNFVSLK